MHKKISIERYTNLHPGVLQEVSSEESCQEKQGDDVMLEEKEEFEKKDWTPADKSSQNQVENPWHKGCLWRCKRCNIDFFNQHERLRDHERSVHKIMEPDTLNKLSDLVNKKNVRHECMICGNLILRETRRIRQHFARCHKLSLSQYESQFPKVLDERTYFKDLEDGIIENVPQSNSYPLGGTSKDSSGERNEKTVKSKDHRIRPDVKKKEQKANQLKSPDNAATNLCNKPVSNKWHKGCLWRCKHCNVNLFSWYKGLRRHERSVHNITVPDSSRKLSYLANRRHVRHKCKICFQSLLRETKNIANHLFNSHELTIPEYEAQFPEVLQERTYFKDLENGIAEDISDRKTTATCEEDKDSEPNLPKEDKRLAKMKKSPSMVFVGDGDAHSEISDALLD